MSMFAFGFAGSASAKVLLYVPSGAFPVHFQGTGGAGTLETLSGVEIKSAQVDALAVILNATLFDLHLEFLKSKAEGLAPCSNTSSSESILVNLLGHLGLTPNSSPAVLLLVPTGFMFTCTIPIIGTKELVLIRGAVIGLITKPEILKAGETELSFKFEQKKGVQEHNTIFINNEELTNQFQESAKDPGAFERSGQAGTATLKILGTETFELKDQ
jgi:hypothetical protein